MNDQWKDLPIIKTNDGTFIIMHGSHPYHVCTQEMDPSGLYDIKEISDFWYNLDDEDSRKVTLNTPAISPD